MEKRQLDLKKVFCYPLGPFHWSLADSNGGLKKTSKVSILHESEKDTEPVVEPIVHHVSIIGGMAMLIWATGKQNIANGSINQPSCRTD